MWRCQAAALSVSASITTRRTCAALAFGRRNLPKVFGDQLFQRFASSEARSSASGVNFKTTISAGKIAAEVMADMPVDGGGKNEYASPKVRSSHIVPD
eukprot:2416789-Rhodomonas_salina.5